MTLGCRQLAAGIAEALCARGYPAVSAEAVVRLTDWSTVRILVVDASVDDHGDETIVLHANVETLLNEARPDSLLRTCSTGVGASVEAAAIDAAEMWVRAEAPLLLSLLNQTAVLDAEWFPDGDPQGVTGWDLFSSPYMLRGAPADMAAVTPIVQEFPPLEVVRDRLAADLSRDAVFHTVSIFLGEGGGARNFECRVDGEEVDHLSTALRHARWTSRPLSWAMVRQSMLLLRPG